MLSSFNQIAHQAWARSKTPLERMYDHWVGEGEWEPAPPPPVTFRLYHHTTDEAIPCHLCGSTDRWVVEGDEVRQVARVFVCEHEPVWAGVGMIRQISSVSVSLVGRCEETSRFDA